MPDINQSSEFRKRLEASIEKNLPVLNKLESHLGCTKCHGPLVEGHCPLCQMGDFEMGNDGKMRLRKTLKVPDGDHRR